MLHLVAASLVFGLTVVLLVVPSIYFDQNLVGYADPDAHNINDDVPTYPLSTRQRLYLVFMLPTMVCLNALFVYVAYYRHVRNVFYRMELSEMEQSALLAAARPLVQLLQSVSTAPAATSSSGHGGDEAQVNSSATFRSSARGAHPLQELSMPSASLFTQSIPLTATGSFVLAAVPTCGSAAHRSSRAHSDLQAHRRRTDVSRDACPTPWMSDVATLVDVIDRVLAESASLRRKASAVLLQRFQAAKPALLQLEEGLRTSLDTVGSPSVMSPSRIQLDALRHATSLSVGNVQEEVAALEAIAAGNGEELASAALDAYVSSRGAPTKYSATAAEASARQLGENTRDALSRGSRIAPSQSSSPRGRRLRRAHSRVVFTRSKSRGHSEPTFDSASYRHQSAAQQTSTWHDESQFQ